MSTNQVVGSLVLLVIATFASPLLAEETGEQATATAESGGGEFSPPQIILGTQKQPIFPPAAFDARYTGSVLVEMTVLKDGTVGETIVIECTRPKVGFEEAAIAAVKQWQFQPGLENGEPIEVKTRIKLNFTRVGVGVQAKPQVSAGSFTTTDRSTGETPAASFGGGSSGPDPK